MDIWIRTPSSNYCATMQLHRKECTKCTLKTRPKPISNCSFSWQFAHRIGWDRCPKQQPSHAFVKTSLIRKHLRAWKVFSYPLSFDLFTSRDSWDCVRRRVGTQLWHDFTCDVLLLRMPLAPSRRYGVMLLCTIITLLFTQVYYQSHVHTYCSHFQNVHKLTICVVLRGPGSGSALRLLPPYRPAFKA